MGMSGGCTARQPGAHAEAQTRQTNSYLANTATPIEANTAFELKRGGGGWDGGGQRGAPSWGRAVDVGMSGGCTARQPGAHAEAQTRQTNSYQLLWHIKYSIGTQEGGAVGGRGERPTGAGRLMWVHREGVQLGSPAHTQRRSPKRPTPINSYGKILCLQL